MGVPRSVWVMSALSWALSMPNSLRLNMSKCRVLRSGQVAALSRAGRTMGSMYNGVKVLDVHGHVSSPDATSNYLTMMMASNTAMPSPLAPGARATPGLSAEDFKRASQRHVEYMDARNIDVQIIGPRPFRVMGFMEEHLTPNWARFVNECIHQQCQDSPDRFVGA